MVHRFLHFVAGLCSCYIVDLIVYMAFGDTTGTKREMIGFQPSNHKWMRAVSYFLGNFVQVLLKSRDGQFVDVDSLNVSDNVKQLLKEVDAEGRFESQQLRKNDSCIFADVETYKKNSLSNQPTNILKPINHN